MAERSHGPVRLGIIGAGVAATTAHIYYSLTTRTPTSAMGVLMLIAICSRAISSASSRRRAWVTAPIFGIRMLHPDRSWVISRSKHRAGPSHVAWLGKNLRSSAPRRQSSSNSSRRFSAIL